MIHHRNVLHHSNTRRSLSCGSAQSWDKRWGPYQTVWFALISAWIKISTDPTVQSHYTTWSDSKVGWGFLIRSVQTLSPQSCEVFFVNFWMQNLLRLPSAAVRSFWESHAKEIAICSDWKRLGLDTRSNCSWQVWRTLSVLKRTAYCKVKLLVYKLYTRPGLWDNRLTIKWLKIWSDLSSAFLSHPCLFD